MDDTEVGDDIPYRAGDGYLEWWNACIEVRRGRVSMLLDLGGLRQDDAHLEVVREALRFWAETLG